MNDEDRERLVRIEVIGEQLLKNTSDHEKRLRWLEKEAWLHRGGLAILTFIAGKIGFGVHFG